MSKKAGKKVKVKAPEIDPNSPEWAEEAARKQCEAYDMVQRAMTRSQIELVLTARDNLLKQKAELETQAKQQSHNQGEIYHYLRSKLKDNYVAIAELEAKVSHMHDERLTQEKQLLATIRDLDEKRESEKIRLEERLANVGVELMAIKEYQENSEIYEQTMREMEAKVAGYKDAFRSEVVLLNSQFEEEQEAGRKDKEERIKITKKAAAKATQEQLGLKTKHRIAQNKKMMSELRFQCFEVEKMQRARQGLMKSNTLLLAQAASARHRVEGLARRSNLLQRTIRHMHQKLQKRREFPDGIGIGKGDTDGHERPGPSQVTVGRTNGAGGGGEGKNRQNRTRYKLGGMSKEERQQLLDLREQLRREELAIAAAQTRVEEMSDEVRRAEAEISRTLALKADMARVLALCHEDPLLGIDGGNGLRAETGGIQENGVGHHHATPTGGLKSSPALSPQNIDDFEASALSQLRRSDPPTGRINGGGDGVGSQGPQPKETADSTGLLPAIDAGKRLQQQQRREPEQNNHDQQSQKQELRQQHQHQARQRGHAALEATTGPGADGAEENTPGVVGTSRGNKPGNVCGDLALWPESAILPTPAVAGMSAGEGGGARDRERPHGEETARFMDTKVLKAVARLFLSKLQISVEAITARVFSAQHDPADDITTVITGASLDSGSGGPKDGVSLGAKKLRRPKHASRNGARNSRAKRHDGRFDNEQHARRSQGRAVFDNRSADDKCRDAGCHGGSGRRWIEGPDDATSVCSDWYPTGIPSWDMLEPAVRQTKRRRTCEAACQTLTYRELRDHANTTAFASNSSMSCKHISNTSWTRCDPNPHTHPGGLRQALPRQPQHQQQAHIVPAARYMSTLHPPSSPLSSATTVSSASVYRVANGGGIVHGAIVRGGTHGGCGGGSRPWPARRQECVAGCVRGGGRDMSEEAFPFRPAHAGGHTATARQQRCRVDEVNNPFFTEGVDESGLSARSKDSHSTSRRWLSWRSKQHPQKSAELAGSPAPTLHQPNTSRIQLTSHPLRHVSVSWGQEEPEREQEGAKRTGPFAAVRQPAVGVPSHTRDGRRPVASSRGSEMWSTGARDEGTGQISGSRSCAGGGGLEYKPLSKGPDYRKVLFFTVDDAGSRILRHALVADSPTSKVSNNGSPRSVGIAND